MLAFFVPIGAGHFYARHGAAGTIFAVGMIGAVLGSIAFGHPELLSRVDDPRRARRGRRVPRGASLQPEARPARTPSSGNGPWARWSLHTASRGSGPPGLSGPAPPGRAPPYGKAAAPLFRRSPRSWYSRAPNSSGARYEHVRDEQAGRPADHDGLWATKLNVPDNPIIPFIEGDGTGPDIWRASVRVFDAAVEKAYGGKKKIAWYEVLAGEKAFKQTNNWLPDETVDGLPEVPRRHQGPAHHADRRRHPLAERRAPPDARSLRLPAPRALVHRACPRPVKKPEDVDMVIFRENTEDIYAGIEWEARHAEAQEGPRLPREGVPEGLQEDPLPRAATRHRHQARRAQRGHRAPRRAPRSSTRIDARSARASRSSTRATS